MPTIHDFCRDNPGAGSGLTGDDMEALAPHVEDSTRAGRHICTRPIGSGGSLDLLDLWDGLDTPAVLVRFPGGAAILRFTDGHDAARTFLATTRLILHPPTDRSTP